MITHENITWKCSAITTRKERSYTHTLNRKTRIENIAAEILKYGGSETEKFVTIICQEIFSTIQWQTIVNPVLDNTCFKERKSENMQEIQSIRVVMEKQL